MKVSGYEHALKITLEIGDWRGESAWLNNLGVAFRNKKKYKEALALPAGYRCTYHAKRS